jgi:hypothetical protein
MAHSVPSAGGHPSSTAGEISIPWIVLSALLCGVGLFALAYWFLTENWLYFAGLVPVIVGALMFLSPRMGPDHA